MSNTPRFFIYLISICVIGSIVLVVFYQNPDLYNNINATINGHDLQNDKINTLEHEIQMQNDTINNLVQFINQQQIPFDNQVINYTRSHP